MKAKTIVTAILVASGLQMFAATPTVSDVVARQRYPWNGMVDIDYTITGDTVGLKLEIGVEDRQSGKTYSPTKFLSVLPTSAGRHRVTWSTEAEGVTIISTNVAVTVSLVQVDPAYQKKNLYYVVDLSGGPTATSYPVATLEAPYSAEWSDEYKTTKLVLRRIEAGEDPLKRYTITKPFYIGVFEVTQKQYELIMGNNPVWWDKYKGDMRAVNCVSYDMIRGDSSGAGWPSSADIDPGSFLSQLRNKTGVDFELPTSAQWEYSCRAGTTSKYNNGGDDEADLRTLGRFAGNNNDGRGGFPSVAIVGSYAPNGWGLYDMHGNVDEWCLDWYSYSAYSELCGSDPVGPVEPSGDRVFRGGNWAENSSASSDIHSHYSSRAYNDIGFRIVCPAGK